MSGTVPASEGWVTNWLGELDRRWRKLVFSFGAALTLSVFLGLGWFVVLSDIAWHWRHPMMRWLMFAVWIIGSCITAYLSWIRPLLQKRSPRDWARICCAHFPDARHELFAAVDFQTNAGVPSASEELLEDVRQKAMRALRGERPQDLLDPQLRNFALMGAMAVLVLGVLLACWQPEAASKSWMRLTLPWVHLPWPRQTRFEVVLADGTVWDLNNHSAADGETDGLPVVEADVPLGWILRNTQGALPEDAAFEWRQSGNPSLGQLHSEQRWNLSASGLNEPESDPIALRLPAGDWQIRVVGGDADDTPWYRVKSTPGARVVKFDWKILPPDYTQHLPYEPESRMATVVVGSELEWRIQASVALDRVELFENAFGVRSSPARRVNSGTLAPSAASSDTQWMGSLRLETAGSYELSLRTTSREGLSNHLRQMVVVRVVDDHPPTLKWESPADETTVTPDSRVNWQLRWQDDYGLESLRWEATGRAFKAGAEMVDPDQRTLWSGTGGETQGWLDLSEGTLQPGDAVTLRATARDGCRPAPHAMVSDSLRLLVVSAEAKTRELSQRTFELANDLKRVEQDERRLLRTLRDALQELSTDTGNSTSAASLLAKTEHDALRLQRDIGQPEHGVVDQARRVAQELERHRLQDADITRQLKRIEESWRSVDESTDGLRDEMTGVLEAIAKSRQDIPQDPTQDKNLAARSTEDAIVRQTKVVQKLSTLNEQLASWESVRSVKDRLQAIEADQRQLQRDVAGQRTRPAAQNPVEQSNQSSRRQKQLSEDLQHLRDRLATQLAESPVDPMGALNHNAPERTIEAPLRQLIETMQSQPLEPLMREAARTLTEGNIMDALEQQAEITKRLEEWSRQLAQDERAQKNPRDGNEAISGKPGEQPETPETPPPAELASELQKLSDEQQKLNDDSGVMKQEREQGKGWERSQLKRMQELTRGQQQLAERTNQLSQKMPGDPGSTLEAVRKEQLTAAKLLESRQLDETTLKHQAEALATLQTLAKHTRENRKSVTSNGEGQQAGEQQTADNQPVNPSDQKGNSANSNENRGQRSQSPTDSSLPGVLTNAVPNRPNRQQETGVWGHLPVQAQQQLRGSAATRPLPEYEQAIRRYYERLAVEGKPR